LVDYARSIDGVDIGALIEERPGGSVKASLRREGAGVSRRFGGGGIQRRRSRLRGGLNLKSGAGDFYARLVAALAKRIAAVDGAKKV